MLRLLKRFQIVRYWTNDENYLVCKYQKHRAPKKSLQCSAANESNIMKTGIAIYLTIAFNGFLLGLEDLAGNEMGPSILFSVILLVALIFRWFKQDNLKRGYQNILDRGMFLLTAGHIILPLYLIWTRRLKGILLMLLALLCFIVPLIVLAIIMLIAT